MQLRHAHRHTGIFPSPHCLSSFSMLDACEGSLECMDDLCDVNGLGEAWRPILLTRARAHTHTHTHTHALPPSLFLHSLSLSLSISSLSLSLSLLSLLSPLSTLHSPLHSLSLSLSIPPYLLFSRCVCKSVAVHMGVVCHTHGVCIFTLLTTQRRACFYRSIAIEMGLHPDIFRKCSGQELMRLS